MCFSYRVFYRLQTHQSLNKFIAYFCATAGKYIYVCVCAFGISAASTSAGAIWQISLITKVNMRLSKQNCSSNHVCTNLTFLHCNAFSDFYALISNMPLIQLRFCFNKPHRFFDTSTHNSLFNIFHFTFESI